MPLADGDTLYIFWGGHGQIAQNGERVLYYADAVDGSLCNLDLENLLLTLGTDRYQRFQRQTIFVDACANHISLANPLPKQSFTPGNQVSGIEHFALFAASAGESAGNNDVQLTGDFSRVVLDWLDRSAAYSPPENEALAKHVERHFAALRQAGQSNQTPMWIRRGWLGSAGSDLDGNLIYAFDPLRAKLMRQILKFANDCCIADTDWLFFYRQTMGYLNRQIPIANTLADMLHHLYNAPWQATEKNADVGDIPVRAKYPDPMLEFIWRAERANPEVVDPGKLITAQMTENQKANLLQRLEEERPEPHHHLMVKLGSPASIEQQKRRPFRQELEWWLWETQEKGIVPTDGTVKDAETKVASLLDYVNSNYVTAKLSLEFLLPLKHLFSLDVAQWKDSGKSPLSPAYSVVIRWNDRPTHEQNNWLQFAAKLHKDKTRCATPTVQWLPDPLLPAEAIKPKFRNFTNCHPLVGFAVPPTQTKEHSDLRKTALECGAPFIFWPRQPVADNQKLKDRIDETVGRGSLDQTPELMRQLLQDALVEQNQPATSLTIFWDDPRRNPYASGGFKPME
ncbi:MAG: hypothetical protein SF097_15020 [Acidobacteriota bacterium]|nr:hypothetical protein [Acidobacteriota bacterium]